MKSINQILNNKGNTDSPIEEILYQEFLVYGIKPETQYQIGSFYVDLAFPQIKLAIEADGQAYHSSPEQKARDRYRENRIKSQGWTLERFTGSFIHREFELIVAKIVMKYLEKDLSEELKLRATGRLVDFFTRKDTRFASEMVEIYMKGFVFRKISK